jgi:hypothetical protein
MTIKNRDRRSAEALSVHLRRLPEVVEFRIAPTGDYAGKQGQSKFALGELAQIPLGILARLTRLLRLLCCGSLTHGGRATQFDLVTKTKETRYATKAICFAWSCSPTVRAIGYAG